MSRLSNHQIELPELVIDMKRMCYEKYENILTMIKATTNLQEEHSWLKNDAYIIRYEDLIKETRQQAFKLLKFANLTLLPIHEPHFEKVLNEAQSEKLDDWRKFLDLDDVEGGVCKPVLVVFQKTLEKPGFWNKPQEQSFAL